MPVIHYASEPISLAIVGGGAAGLTAAIFAAQAAGSGVGIVVLDTARSLGAKILVAGGGRCNVTHERVTPRDYNGAQPVVRNILAAFDADAAVAWFASLGVTLKREETGKLFPTTDSARTVLNALLRRCDELGVTIRAGCRVIAVAPPSDEGRFFTVMLESSAGPLRATRLLLATGGRSLPKTGSDGSGWRLAAQLGHSVTETYAALAPLLLDPTRCFHAELSGLSQIVELTTVASGKPIDRRRGSLLWTHFGISGPVVMDASRHWVISHARGDDPQLRCNLLPGETFETLERYLLESTRLRPRSSIGAVLGERLAQRTAITLLNHLKIASATSLAQLVRESRRALVHGMTDFLLPVTGHRGWNYAEVTAGGVPLSEIDYRTMASRRQEDLYLAGEMLDCDGRIGGFNFQWAWATGYLAGRAAGWR